jgi:two-component system sensor histidine kinase PilS (NtrC family)
LLRLRPFYDGPVSWLWFVGSARIALILVVASGALLRGESGESESPFPLLVTIYCAALFSSVWYLVVLRRERFISAVLTWMQVLVDFGVVAATISFTGGQQSFFTFLLVIVILEAGFLMGLAQGFVFASLASLFMLFHAVWWDVRPADALTHWYNFLVQGIGFFFTAFISGYWNQRVSRMQQFQREILDNMSSGFLITNVKGVVISINKSACEILDLVESNVAGRHVEGIIRTESGTECPVTTALRTGSDFTSYEFFAETGGHGSKLLGLTTNGMLDSHGHVTGLIASFTDLTEMARMRQELQQQDRLAVVGELAAGLAHEIRNPVAAIRSSVDEIGGNLGTPELLRKLSAIALRSSDHLDEIVTGFLNFARKPVQRNESFSLGELVLEVRDQLLRKYQEGVGARVVVDVPSERVEILGDRTQVWQVFMNLGQNGIEAMGESGTLEISVRLLQGPVEVRFDDSGRGIDPDKVARIFEPFYTEKERGVGMGLAICNRIVSAHNGTIQVASRPGGGTSMSVRLPRVNE